MIQFLPTKSNYKNLYYRDTEKSDITKLQAICDSWTDKLMVEGETFSPDYITNCIENGDLPPIENARFENYYFKSICNRLTNEIIGFFDIYHGYPSVEVLWIGMFVIDNQAQNSGYGSETIELLSRLAKESGFSTLGIGVYLKNWKGLRFWIKNGFNRIDRITGDNEYATDNFALIKLSKSI